MEKSRTICVSALLVRRILSKCAAYYLRTVRVMDSAPQLQPVNVRIVLVETTHAGNIGAVARAMRNMCVTELVLVNPKKFPHPDAVARASGALAELDNAKVVPTLQEAVAGCNYVFGTTARERGLDWQPDTPQSTAEKIVAAGADVPCAIVFGRERSGLTNEEVEMCTHTVNIPTNPKFSSLNLGMAVQVLTYELMKARGGQVATKAVDEEASALPASADAFEAMIKHMEEAMTHSGFYDPNDPRMTQRRMRQIFRQANLDAAQVNMLRGMWNSVLQLPKGPHSKS